MIQRGEDARDVVRLGVIHRPNRAEADMRVTPIIEPSSGNGSSRIVLIVPSERPDAAGSATGNPSNIASSLPRSAVHAIARIAEAFGAGGSRDTRHDAG